MSIEVRIVVEEVHQLSSLMGVLEPCGVRPDVSVSGGSMTLRYDFTDDAPSADPVAVDVLKLYPEDGRPLAGTPVAVQFFGSGSERDTEPDDDLSTLSCADAIVALLEGEPDEQLTAAEVAAELPRWTKGTIAFTLASLHRDGRIGRPARGKYQAAS